MSGARCTAQLSGGLLVIGIGNPDRADDGVGPLVARRVEQRRLEGVRVMVRSGDLLTLLEDWVGAQALVLIDAASTHARPGEIRRFDLAVHAVPTDLCLTSTHAFGLAEVLALGRALRRLPPDTTLYAVTGSCFAAGAPMTAAVTTAAAEVEAQVLRELRSHLFCAEHRYFL